MFAAPLLVLVFRLWEYKFLFLQTPGSHVRGAGLGVLAEYFSWCSRVTVWGCAFRSSHQEEANPVLWLINSPQLTAMPGIRAALAAGYTPSFLSQIFKWQTRVDEREL